jgi:hypothetical protein
MNFVQYKTLVSQIVYALVAESPSFQLQSSSMASLSNLSNLVSNSSYSRSFSSSSRRSLNILFFKATRFILTGSLIVEVPAEPTACGAGNGLAGG